MVLGDLRNNGLQKVVFLVFSSALLFCNILAIFLVLKNQKGHLHSGEIELELEVKKLEHKKRFAEEQI